MKTIKSRFKRCISKIKEIFKIGIFNKPKRIITQEEFNNIVDITGGIGLQFKYINFDNIIIKDIHFKNCCFYGCVFPKTTKIIGDTKFIDSPIKYCVISTGPFEVKDSFRTFFAEKYKVIII